jgi:leucyl-tRNA synthetase
MGFVPGVEPYKKRTSSGLIMGADGQKMSKSRGNVVNPDEIVENYGADTFRLYEMFIGPFDQVAMWSEESLMGVYRFVGKVYSLFAKVKKVDMTEADTRAMHKAILEVTERIDQMKFNTAVSSLMTYVNYMANMDIVPTEMYETLLRLMCPFTPHLCEEMWARLGHDDLLIKAAWPKGDAKLAEDNVVTYAVQICGKMRGTIEMPKDASPDVVKAKALELDNVKRQLEGKEIGKVIVVPNRLINLVA